MRWLISLINITSHEQLVCLAGQCVNNTVHRYGQLYVYIAYRPYQRIAIVSCHKYRELVLVVDLREGLWVTALPPCHFKEYK